MLLSLHIKNYALIEELKLDFESGLTVVTGETGSGKSILIGALGLALGDRATISSVRHGSHICSIEAKFKAQHISDRNYDPETLRRRDLLEDQGRLAYHEHGFQTGCHRIKPYSDLAALSQQIRELESVQREILQCLSSCDD